MKNLGFFFWEKLKSKSQSVTQPKAMFMYICTIKHLGQSRSYRMHILYIRVTIKKKNIMLTKCKKVYSAWSSKSGSKTKKCKGSIFPWSQDRKPQTCPTNNKEQIYGDIYINKIIQYTYNLTQTQGNEPQRMRIGKGVHSFSTIFSYFFCFYKKHQLPTLRQFLINR